MLKVRRSETGAKAWLVDLERHQKTIKSWPGRMDFIVSKVAIAAMDCQSLDVQRDCIRLLRKSFPESKRVWQARCYVCLRRRDLGRAEKAYSSFLGGKSTRVK
ncbi:hypothetical protein L3X38_035674 [Prunus dulcis]|uniref:Uncharacterized protein n=1 Tax=Prunus dulcis TaxID=3755 RepID=A0AAD4VK42_PRUDU|nr:hypothetical protein L3X38_035674 [Prunus dulcis]